MCLIMLQRHADDAVSRRGGERRIGTQRNLKTMRRRTQRMVKRQPRMRMRMSMERTATMHRMVQEMLRAERGAKEW